MGLALQTMFMVLRTHVTTWLYTSKNELLSAAACCEGNHSITFFNHSKECSSASQIRKVKKSNLAVTVLHFFFLLVFFITGFLVTFFVFVYSFVFFRFLGSLTKDDQYRRFP